MQILVVKVQLLIGEKVKEQNLNYVWRKVIFAPCKKKDDKSEFSIMTY